MPKQIVQHKTKPLLMVTEERMNALSTWLFNEIHDALSARMPLEKQWQDNMRQYEGVPRAAARNVPIENAPNVEITLGAIASDSIYAQAIDLIFGTSPLITVRPVPKGRNDQAAIDTAKASQRFLNLIATNEVGLRDAIEEAVLDDVQLGTGILYTPWVVRVRKTKTSKIEARSPMIYGIAPEDCIVPSGTPHDIQNMPWIALRFWRTKEELNERAKIDNWNIEGAQMAGAKDWVRTRREMLGKQMEGMARKGTLYDTYDVYCYFDIDGDGIEEDLYVVWNQTGQCIFKVGYNPLDRRPIDKMCYQRRGHLFYGLGVLTMIAPYEETLTEAYNYHLLNSLLANSRVWVGREGHIPETMQIWPSKVVLVPEPDRDLKALQMADTNPSLIYLQQFLIQLSDNRVGTNAMSQPKPSQIMGSRTPGITALSLLQQVNRRFTPAFDGMRLASAGALKQCIYRYQERILAGDAEVGAHIMRMLGPEDGNLVVNLLRDKNFDENISIELTASSASVNREADRQNAMMLVNILSQYYQRTLELVAIASNPQTPEPVRDVARKIASSAGEIIDRTIRTFDQVRDPATFIIEVGDELDQAQMDTQGLQGLMGMLGM